MGESLGDNFLISFGKEAAMSFKQNQVKNVIPYIMMFYILNKNLFDYATMGLSKAAYYALVLIGTFLCFYEMLKCNYLRDLGVAFAIYAGIILANGLMLSNADQFIYGIKAYLTYYFPFFALMFYMQGIKDYTKLFKGLAIWGGITGVLAVCEYVLGHSVLPGYMGRVYLYANGDSAYRATVFVGSPMVLGILLGTSVVSNVLFWHRDKKIWYLLFAVLGVAGLLCTGSRAPLVWCVLGVVVLLFLFARQRTLSPITIVLLVILAVAGIVVLVSFAVFPELSTGFSELDLLIRRVTSTFDFSNEWGNHARLMIWKHYIGEFWERPFAGYGLGTTSAEVASNVPINYGQFWQIVAESGVLTRLVESGLVGTISYYVFVFLCIRRGLKNILMRTNRIEKNSLLLAVVGILTIFFAEDIILQISYDIYCTFILCFVLAYAVNLRREKKDTILYRW